MSDTEQNKQDDELDLAPETVEDLDADGGDIKGALLGKGTTGAGCY